MPITEQELVSAIEERNGYPLNDNQRNAILYGDGPLLIAAGPGTGKTEVLVTRCLKYICCDAVNPKSIVITTFTEKAAQNLQDRISDKILHLAEVYPQLSAIDPSELRVGTLHGLCNDILQEYRYINYQNLRLLDEVEAALLIYSEISGDVKDNPGGLYQQFGYLFPRNKQLQHLSRWDWTIVLRNLLERIVDDRINLQDMHEAEGVWPEIAEIAEEYDAILDERHACDFSRLQRHFLEFLQTDQGNIFLNGDGTQFKPPLTHILVDEYQDTNPIQQEIYLSLSDGHNHNLTVVGDDDQALYRFRGGTVECMIGFSEVCQNRWNTDVGVEYLSENYRSDGAIVEWCNNYIGSFPQMEVPHARIVNKPPLGSFLGSNEDYPAVALIRQGTVANCAQSVATLINELLQNSVIQDYSQCALLLPSTKNTPRNAGPYINALNALDIPIYNPRSKDYLEQEEVSQCLGAFLSIIDPNLNYIGHLNAPQITAMVSGWLDSYQNISGNYQELADYVARSAQAIGEIAVGTRIESATPGIIYRIISHEPFVTYQLDPARDLRLSKLTRIFESFCALYGRQLWSDNDHVGQINNVWLSRFYFAFCGYLKERGMDDDEDDEVISPSGYLPIMTIHQAKGLEFDFVIVGNLGATVRPNSSHQLEHDLIPYRIEEPQVVHTTQDGMWHDQIRLHYVAYSRAKYSLILSATTGQLRKTGEESASFGGSGGTWVRQNLTRL